jgi:uncharacterized membrane protein YeaQ/YmgE (transglycosylase-associated protein family)
MAIFIYTFIGLVMGVVSFVALPTTRRVGLVGGALLGMAGGTLGGLIGTAISPSDVLARISPLGVVLALIGSCLVAVGLILFSRERPTA